MELLRSKTTVTDIQVVAEVWSAVSYCRHPRPPSSLCFHLTDTGTLFNEFVGWTDIEMTTIYSLEF